MIEARRPMIWPRQSITTSFSNISTSKVRHGVHSTENQADGSLELCFPQQTSSYKYSHTTLELRGHAMELKNLLPSRLDEEGSLLAYAGFLTKTILRSVFCL